MKPDDISPEQMDRAQDSLEAFAELIGRPMAAWQLAALQLPTRQTCLVAPRQTGKSWSLATLACWWAFRQPDQMVLIVSAGEIAAGRLLREIQRISAGPLLAGSVTDETQSRVILSSGSEIRSLPASERQVRGWSADLLICDESAFISEDLLTGAAIPTTMARPHAKIVLASTPWGTEGAFYRIATSGMDPASPVTRTFVWHLSQATWVTPEAIEQLREALSPLRFRAEVMGEWIPGGESFFSHEDLLACTAEFPMVRDGGGAPAVMGLDWGRQRDRHAIAVAGLLDDGGANGRPVVILPWVETSQRGYDDQFTEITALTELWSLLAVRSESNGPGGPATELLAGKVTRAPVRPVFSTQRDKEQAYAKLSMLLEQRAIVLPNHPELLRQLGGVAAEPTPSGGMRLAARTESLHDDLPDAVTLAVAGLPARLAEVPVREMPDGQQWCQTPAGTRIPVPVLTMRAEESYAGLNGGYVHCSECRLPYPAYRETCTTPGCTGRNPGYDPAAPVPVGAAPQRPVAAPQGDAVPAGNQYNQDLWKCPAGHLFDHRFSDQCPRCSPGSGGSGAQRPGPLPGGGLPPGLATRLGGILGTGR